MAKIIMFRAPKTKQQTTMHFLESENSMKYPNKIKKMN